MNVAISAIAKDLGTTVAGVQTAITLFTLTMAALMIPGSKLTDIWGRKRCFVLGLIVYAIGACWPRWRRAAGADHRVLAAGGRGLGADDPAHLHPGHGDLPRRQVAGQVLRRGQRRGGLGAAAGPLIGGLVTSADQLARLVRPPGPGRALDHPAGPQDHGPGPDRAQAHFDLTGAVLSAAGLFFVVLGLLQSRTYGFLIRGRRSRSVAPW